MVAKAKSKPTPKAKTKANGGGKGDKERKGKGKRHDKEQKGNDKGNGERKQSTPEEKKAIPCNQFKKDGNCTSGYACAFWHGQAGIGTPGVPMLET